MNKLPSRGGRSSCCPYCCIATAHPQQDQGPSLLISAGRRTSAVRPSLARASLILSLGSYYAFPPDLVSGDHMPQVQLLSSLSPSERGLKATTQTFKGHIGSCKKAYGGPIQAHRCRHCSGIRGLDNSPPELSKQRRVPLATKAHQPKLLQPLLNLPS